MNSSRGTLGLGFELIGFMIFAYGSHQVVADQFGWNADKTLAGLCALFFVIWLGHLALYTSRQSE